MDYFWAFVVGGAFCGLAQIILDKTKITAARILVFYVVAGVVLSAVGLFQPLKELA
ncbi:MAG: SpoVA/SpoVAEb family sporulation membrane protein, partial [Oscillospiraceae bacterium]|nr:SpoVA/SpoVAEb family sporulation membrane protein [Oscillospiraceae bacterium]